ncbi:MAG: Crp/Fnr family transcriptional regulator [Okeania sp. SIO3I5]|uniref:Crp/Fnr family transcriptional regulator n=1 Tax=Okeania sp. SIO3I5 TaxID=2607805 RepID=UPI0013BB86DB|nr:Crp/Fnr family transcriptional regulator [Okeania sp. SIO3I5]NEQ39744.1 Crp/Fnr family transcriptional regulator [Okeania sp. SIO3I5]
MAPTSRAIIETNQYNDNAGTERHLHFYHKGETIPLMSQSIWQICQGLVRLSTLYPVGEEGLLGWAGPSMCFGSCFSYLHTYRATALSDVCLMCYTMIEIEASPKLTQELLPQLGRRFRQTEALLAIAGQRRVEDRLHQLLLLLKQEFGQPVSDGTRLNIRLTHQDIAAAIGTTRVTVTRLLGKLKQQGWLSIDKDRHLILKQETFPYSSDLFGFEKN